MKKINNIIIILSLVIELIYFIMNPIITVDNILLLLSFIPVILIPRIFNYIFKNSKIKIEDDVEFVYLIFLILAFLFGSIMGGYSKIYWYDSFTHLLSGIFTAFMAPIVLKWLNRYDKKDIVFNIIYIIIVTLSVAVLWECVEFTIDKVLGECVEFTIDKVLGMDTQKVLTTGVNDTMKDMICALVGSILYSIYYLYNLQDKCQNLWCH